MTNQNIIRLPQVKQRTGLSRSTIYSLIQRGQLRGIGSPQPPAGPAAEREQGRGLLLDYLMVLSLGTGCARRDFHL